MHILVVDDNPENLRVVSTYLREKGYRIALAMNGEEAFDVLAGNAVDLVLLDVMMPGMDGFEVCHKLKKDKELADIPVIFLTARDETDDVVQGFRIGGVDYITKPFRKEELYARVNNHLQLKMARDMLRKHADTFKSSRNELMRQLMELARIFDKES